MSSHFIGRFVGVVPEPVTEDRIAEEGFGILEESVYHCQNLFSISTWDPWMHTEVKLSRGTICHGNAHETVESLRVVKRRAGSETDAPIAY